MDEQKVNTPVEKLEKEIHQLERQISHCTDAGEKRMLKRRLKKAQYMLLMMLGKLG